VSDDTAVAAACVEASDEHPFPTGFEVLTKSGRRARSRKLLFATGVRDELPEVPGVRECYGVSVHHCPYCDGWEHRDQRLAAYGRSPAAAAGLGLSLRTWSDRVIVLTDGERLDDRHRKQLRQNGVRFAEQRITRLTADDCRLKKVEFEGAPSIEIDALFFNTVQIPGSDLPATLGCATRDTETARLTNTSAKQRTSVSGLFLAGDADGDVQFAIVAAAEGATAAVAINRELQDEDRR
jgi:thioredoxin reductase